MAPHRGGLSFGDDALGLLLFVEAVSQSFERSWARAFRDAFALSMDGVVSTAAVCD
jgi:hypothetical protein